MIKLKAIVMKKNRRLSKLKKINRKELSKIQGGNSGSSGRYLQNGSYSRFKTLTLGS